MAGQDRLRRVLRNSLRDLEGEGYDLLAGLTFEYTLGNRTAEALHQRATLSHRQTACSIQNLAQLIATEVHTTLLELRRSFEQVEATAATRRLQEEVLRAETDKCHVGQSTSFLIAQAQLHEVATSINTRQALTNLYRLAGTLLLRHGIAAPGEPYSAEPTSTVEQRY